MELNTIFDYCVDDIICNDAFYYIKPEPCGVSCVNIALTNEGKLLRFSNDWLNLLAHSYTPGDRGIYAAIKEAYDEIIKTKEEIIINEDIIPFISSFSLGTSHGFAGIFDILYQYFKNKDLYKNYKIAIYSKSQTGILEIIEHFCVSGLIDKNKIIIIDAGKKYQFRSVHLIHVTRHAFLPNDPLTLEISKFINENWLTNDNDEINRLCIIKTTDSKNVCSLGCQNKNVVETFCNKYKLFNCNPGVNITENDLICKMKNCEIFITTWGSSYQKNYYYLSEKCKCIIVLFDKMYFDFNIYPHENNDTKVFFPSHYKNAKIFFQVINNSGDIILTPEIENEISLHTPH